MQSLPFAVRAAVICIGLAWIAPGARADTVYLKNGAYIDGLVTARSDTLLTITIGQIGKLEVAMEDVIRVEKNSRTGSRVYAPVDRRELPDVVRKKNESPGSESEEPTEAAGDTAEEEETEDTVEADDTEDGDEPEAETDSALKAEIEQLVSDLQRQKTKHRRRAERRLEKIGAPAVPFLLPLVTRGGDLTRITALRLISVHAKHPDPEVTEVCIKALTDDNYFVRDYGVKTLRRLTGQDFEYDAKAAARSRGRAASKWQEWWEKEKAEDATESDRTRTNEREKAEDDGEVEDAEEVDQAEDVDEDDAEEDTETEDAEDAK